MPESDKKPPRRILIEGVSGIGKTVLAKEIAYQWAKGRILQKCKLLFLLYLRDPKLHKVKSLNELLNLFTSENDSDLYSFIVKDHGNKVAFVFDGFDEYPMELQKQSFITELIKGKNGGRLFLRSTVIVTSRPTATLLLHDTVDRRIEILGFPREERQNYISLLLHSPNEIHKLNMYLKQHPIIDNLCYIPLHLAIVVYLFNQYDLPETLTEMNEYFIINTVYRYLAKTGLILGVVKKLRDFPIEIVDYIYKLSQLAFKGLQKNQLIFTLDEIQKECPEVAYIPGAINGFGLLRTVQHYPQRGAGRTTSVNFLHFTMQEYLAALYVSTLSDEHQLSMMREIFWDGHFSFMWMMYVGIVGVKSNNFASYISSGFYNDNIYEDKRKCLQLFLCYIEAKTGLEMPEGLSSIFTDGKITLDGVTLLPHHISSLNVFMSISSIQQWKILSLGDCNLGDVGMISLLGHFIKNPEHISSLEYVDLSGNHSSPWGVYCVIIKHCCVNSLLTLCGDEGMKDYVEEISYSLQNNATLQSLTLYKIGRVGIQSMEEVLSKNTTLKELNVSWISKGTAKVIYRKLLDDNSELNSNRYEWIVDINILYTDDYEYSSKAINMSNKGINDDAVYLLSFGLCNNTTIQTVDLSCNNITDDGTLAITDCFQSNSSLHKLILSKNHISYNGASEISILLQVNKTISELDISHNIILDIGAIMISESLKTNNSLQELNLSDNHITSKGAWKIAEAIRVNIGLHKLDISQNPICDDGVEYISDSLEYNNTLLELNLSGSKIGNEGGKIIANGIQLNRVLRKLDLSHNSISDDGVIVMSNCLKRNNTLREIILSYTNISEAGLKIITQAINSSEYNTTEA